jgi:hypothetical protein
MPVKLLPAVTACVVVIVLVIAMPAAGARPAPAPVRHQLVAAWQRYLTHEVVEPGRQLLDLVSDACLSSRANTIAALHAWPLQKPRSLEGAQPETVYLLRKAGHWVVAFFGPLDTEPPAVRKRLEEATGCFATYDETAQRLQQGLLPPAGVVRAPSYSDHFVLVGSRFGQLFFYSPLSKIKAVLGKLSGLCGKTRCVFGTGDAQVPLILIFQRGSGPSSGVNYVGKLVQVETVPPVEGVWHTLEGLRVGNSVARLHALYPDACHPHYKNGPNPENGTPPQWILVPATNPAEVAWIGNGKVERLGLVGGADAPSCSLTVP